MADRVAREHLGEVGTDVLEPDVVGRRRGALLDVRGVEQHEHVALEDGVALPDRDPPDDAGALRRHDVLHLHRLHDEEGLPGVHHVALGDVEAHDGALHLGAHRERAVVAAVVARHARLIERHARLIERHARLIEQNVRLVRAPARALAVRQHRERIVRVDARAGELAGGRSGRSAAAGSAAVEKAPRLLARRRHQLGRVALDEARVDGVRGDVRMAEQRLQKAEVGRHAFDAALRERAPRARHGAREPAGGRVHDDLREQRVEARVRRVAGVAEGVDAHARSGRRLEDGERPAARLGVAVGAHRLHVDPELDRVSARRRPAAVAEAERRERGAARELQLGRDEIDARDRLGHRVLDLETRVGLEEVERAVVGARRRVDQELEGAEAPVAHLFRQTERRRDHPLAERRTEARARRDLDELLVAALQRALAFAERDDGATAVADDLHLDVPRARQVALDVEVARAERARGLGAAARVGLGEGRGIADDPHAATAAARDRLQHDRATGRLGGEERARLLHAGRAARARKQRHGETRRQHPRPTLVAEDREHLGARADEDEARVRRARGEVGALGEKAIAGMHGVGARGLGGRDHAVDVEVRGRADAAERPRLVGHPHVQARGVVLGMDRDGPETRVGRGPQDADRDLPAIGDEQRAESHGIDADLRAARGATRRPRAQVSP